MGASKDLGTNRRALCVARAKFLRPTGDLKALLKKRRKASKKAKGVLRRAEEKVRAAGGEPSEQVSSYDSLLRETSSDGSSESNSSKAEEKSVGLSGHSRLDERLKGFWKFLGMGFDHRI